MKRLSLLVLAAMLFAGPVVALEENRLANLESAGQFTGYRVNQPFPAEIEAQLATSVPPTVKAP